MRQCRFSINADIFENLAEEDSLPRLRNVGFDEVFSLYPRLETEKFFARADTICRLAALRADQR